MPCGDTLPGPVMGQGSGLGWTPVFPTFPTYKWDQSKEINDVYGSFYSCDEPLKLHI